MTRTAIIGGGIVGICAAIALARLGHEVVLIDRRAPGQETSRWNAGVLATSSVIPLNTPAIFKLLPRLLVGLHPGFQLNPRAGPQLLPWAARFLGKARRAPSQRSIAALRDLIGHSRQAHDALCRAAEVSCLRSGGWIIAYRGTDGRARADAQGARLGREEVRNQVLSGAALRSLEPNLAPIFSAAVHVEETAFTEPPVLIAAYLDLARRLGVTIIEATVQNLTRQGNAVELQTVDGQIGPFDTVVLAAGPWSNDILKRCAAPLPLAIERGYLQRYATPAPPKRPIYDVIGGYVAAPRPGGVQISTGTELTHLNTPPRPRQLSQAVIRARDALQLGDAISEVNIGNRPSLPDCLPAIGPLRAMPGLWLATGHQHVGFSTSAGTADLLAALIAGTPPPFDPTPFSPARFGL